MGRLHIHDRRRESHRAVKGTAAMSWVTAWPTVECRLSNDQLSVAAAWQMGVPIALLRGIVGRRIKRKGIDKGRLPKSHLVPEA